MKNPGEMLKRLRTRCGLTTRKVDELSRMIAAGKNNDDYTVSHARLVQIENGESTPSLFKLYSLSAIYGCTVTTLMDFFIDSSAACSEHLGMQHEGTHLINFEAPTAEEKVSFPIRFDPGFNPHKSELISRLVETWGTVPASLLQAANIRKGRWGLIGLSDYTMYPLLRPGSLVQIDEGQKAAGEERGFRTEYDRPLYFVELRDGYLCSWCEFRRNRLVCLSHPLSPVASREYAYPAEAEIVGRVTAVAARIVPRPAPKSTPASTGFAAEA